MLQKIQDSLNSCALTDRISNDEYFLSLALLASMRGTCIRRRVGCILVDKNNMVISAGRNGNAPGASHCIDDPCAGAEHGSGQGLEVCEAIHAEINAIIHCIDPSRIHKAYVTHSPCIHCIKALLATPCNEIVFLDEYPHSGSKVLWESNGRTWKHYTAADK